MTAMDDVRVGDLVRARAGRDKGRLFLVTAVLDGQYVTICDGDTRKLASPKRKKRMHLDRALKRGEGRMDATFTGDVCDADIRRHLGAIAVQTAGKEG